MDSYTITITPNDDSGNSTTLTVDTTTGQARITSVHMDAPAGLTGGQMPSVDVGLLLQAVTGASTPAAITATPAPAAKEQETPEPAPAHTDTRPADTGVDENPATAAITTPQLLTDDPASQAPAAVTTPAKRARGRRTAGARTGEGQAAQQASTPGGRRRPAPRKTAAKAAGRRAPAEATAEGGQTGRAYRRMPDDFAVVYRQAGTATAIADHYGVPRYTAQGWIGRHKKQDAATDR